MHLSPIRTDALCDRGCDYTRVRDNFFFFPFSDSVWNRPIQEEKRKEVMELMLEKRKKNQIRREKSFTEGSIVTVWERKYKEVKELRKIRRRRRREGTVRGEHNNWEKHLLKYIKWLHKREESFGWILLNSKFICIIVIVQNYLGNWRKRVNFGNGVVKIQQKYEREREKVRERKFWILAIASPKFLLPKLADQETNCDNAIAKIGEKNFYGNCGNAIAKNGRKKKIVVAEIHVRN